MDQTQPITSTNGELTEEELQKLKNGCLIGKDLGEDFHVITIEEEPVNI